MPRIPTELPKTLNVTPLQPKLDAKRKPGRPANLVPPPPPEFEWQSEYEKQLFDYFMAAVPLDYPGLRPSDYLILPLAAAEYVKCLRLLGKEIASGELVLMSRQHPSTFFARYMDQLLGATRKNRVRAGEKEKDDSVDFSELYRTGA